MANSESEDSASASSLMVAIVLNVLPLFGLVILVLTAVKGFVWYSETLYPVVSSILAWPLGISILLGIVLSILKRTRSLGGSFFLIAAYLYFCSIWLQSVTVAFGLAGTVWTIVGLVFAGVGVIGVAFFASILTGEWGTLAGLLIMLAIAGALYTLAVYILGSVSANDAEASS